MVLVFNNLFLFYLGTFEESVLNGRLEPVSTVHGFRAELGASGSFVPRHLFCPVTVFFYNLGDSDKVSSPYLVSQNIVYLQVFYVQRCVSRLNQRRLRLEGATRYLIQPACIDLNGVIRRAI